MRTARVYVNNIYAGDLIEFDNNTYQFKYQDDYQGDPVSLTLPTMQREYDFSNFPSFFDGLLPEGPQLEALLRLQKLDRTDYFGQLITVGADMVGNVTVKEA